MDLQFIIHGGNAFWQACDSRAIVFSGGSLAVLLGLVLLLGIECCWQRIEPFYNESIGKTAVAIFRALVGSLAIFSKAAAADTSGAFFTWEKATFVAIVGWLIWEAIGIRGDAKLKASKDTSLADAATRSAREVALRESVESEYFRLVHMNSQLNSLVREKLERVKRVVQANPANRATIAQVREALKPRQQIEAILQLLTQLFAKDSPASKQSLTQNFRVGLYAEVSQTGQLEPIGSFDWRSRSASPFSSFHAHPERFRLQDGTSHAVQCIQTGAMLIISDCAADPGFEYFNSAQRNYLRSLIAYPIRRLAADGNRIVPAALLIDTDVAGYFKELDRESIAARLDEFVARIELELAMDGLLTDP